jgi:hypothetical protein
MGVPREVPCMGGAKGGAMHGGAMRGAMHGGAMGVTMHGGAMGGAMHGRYHSYGVAIHCLGKGCIQISRCASAAEQGTGS